MIRYIDKAGFSSALEKGKNASFNFVSADTGITADYPNPAVRIVVRFPGSESQPTPDYLADACEVVLLPNDSILNLFGKNRNVTDDQPGAKIRYIGYDRTGWGRWVSGAFSVFEFQPSVFDGSDVSELTFKRLQPDRQFGVILTRIAQQYAEASTLVHAI